MKTKLQYIALQLFILLHTTAIVDGSPNKPKVTTAILRMSGNCTPSTTRLEYFDEVQLTSGVPSNSDMKPSGNVTCSAHFMTGNADQGICIQNNGGFYLSHNLLTELRIFTSRLGPEKTFNSNHLHFTTWCTHEPLVSVELTSVLNTHNQKNDYKFSFQVTNISKSAINRRYHLDTFKQCNLSHLLKPGEKIQISGQEYPALSDLPLSCQLIFSTKSEDVYEEICLSLEEYRADAACLSSLVISGFHTRFWPQSEDLGCNATQSQLVSGAEMCSADKTLTLSLTRTTPSDTGVIFTLNVKAKRHRYWQFITNENAELRGLYFIKGLTYFIAAIDSLAGIAAAVLASMMRHPRSFWKSWAESMNSTGSCEAVQYEVTYPDVSCSEAAEEVSSIKSY